MVCMTLCFFGQSLPEWVHMMRTEEYYVPSALMFSLQAIFFGGVILMIPFCACAACATSQMKALEKDRSIDGTSSAAFNRFVLRKIAANALSGALAVTTAFAFHTILWNLIAEPVNPSRYPWHAISFYGLYEHWYCAIYGLPMYLSILFGMAICGATFAVAALATSAWLPDRILVMAVPAGLYYIWGWVISPLSGWRIPHPADLFNDSLTITAAIQSMLAYAALFVLCGVIYAKGVKRRTTKC